MTSKKEVEIKRGDSLIGGDHGGLGAPWEGDLGGGIMDYGLEVLYLDTPMGQRPGEFAWNALRQCCADDNETTIRRAKPKQPETCEEMNLAEETRKKVVAGIDKVG